MSNSIIKADPHPSVITDAAGNTLDVVTSAPVAGDRGLVVYPMESSSVDQVQTASEGPTGSAVPADATLMGAQNPGGNLQAIAVDGNDAVKVSNLGLSTINSTNQVSVGTSSTLVIAANLSRAGVMVTNTSAATAVYLGNTGVTTATGQYLGPGLSITIPVTCAIYGVAGSAQTVTYMELLP